MPLHAEIAARRDEIIARWKDLVRGTLAPESMPNCELVDHLPRFLDEIAAALRSDDGHASAQPSTDKSPAAAVHGEQRLRLGFSLDAVVREYGALCAAILAVGRDSGSPVTQREEQIVFERTVTGIASAVTEYVQQRDAELMRQANEHFAFIAHELRNPLFSAMTAFQLLKVKGELPAGGHAVGALERGLRRSAELIDQTLQRARVVSGIELRREWTSLDAITADAELDAIAEAEAKGVTLSRGIEKNDRLHVDVRLVRSALGNLLRNGVKYSSAGGRVELRGRVVDGVATIEVEDSCGGLPAGRVEEAFAPFVRLDQTQSGFGLGLAIAKLAVDAHGGKIRIQNLPGKGCIFVLELPAHDATPA